MKKFEYNTDGTCADKVSFDIIDGNIRNCEFNKGCAGNLIGISQLIDGMTVDTVIEKFKGIKCGSSSTSCPDQLALALIKWQELQKH